MHLATASFDLLLSFILLLVLIARQGVALGEVEMTQYAGLVNSIADPIFVCDESGRIRLANRALLQVTGCSETSILGQPVQNLFAAGPGGALNEAILRRALYGNGWDGELSLRRENGTLLPVWLSLRPIPSSSRAGSIRRTKLALAGSAHDLSDPKSQQAALEMAYEQLEQAHAELERLNSNLEEKVAEKTLSLSAAYEQLEAQNRTLQQLDALKSDFVSLVSHELRAPLTNIAGGIELVLHQVRRLPQPTAETLALVQAEIERLTRFVETILDLSALDAGRMPLYPAPLALSDLLPQWQRQIRHLPDQQRVQWQIPNDLPLVLADDQALSSIIFHLLDNAFKYAPQGNITVSAAQQGDWITLQVRDEGEGIPPESINLLFQQFYRRNRDNQTIYGHGLGLYIVRRLLEAMNGRIEAGNAPQRGAVFTCWLPRYAEDFSPEASLDDHFNH
jgi:PAS domain S-box-containing protein